ncbi:hypothetical protein [Ralstonia sp. NFACC01]|uniref:hypothetical protein n=1 Tax=Ralstonia sp. NFACC01 TaxID=1566294 RepID=UPI0008E43020|nr:hypothetical protein [Ralstonia sp. NFACC01]SFO90855.1 hypothetical protein SAMN03159417_00569 [Ralstonia sp. NFACC01]
MHITSTRNATLIAALVLCLAQPVNAQTDKPSPYAEVGIPASSRIWSSEDYIKTARILATGAVPLPRFSTKDGADLLARMTALENLAILHNHSVPIEPRFADYDKYLAGGNAIRKVYTDAAFKANPPKDELAALMAFLLHLATTGFELANEYLATVPRDDQYPKRLEGLERMKVLLTSLVANAQRMSENEKAVEPRGRSLLLKALSDTLPITKSAFSSDYKIELFLNLRADRDFYDDPGDKQLCAAMLAELGESVLLPETGTNSR